MAAITISNGRHAGVPDRPESSARDSLRRWLDQIVATLPEPRQQLFDLFVIRGVDPQTAALELGTSVAEVRRLRFENEDAILRAFEVNALAADASCCWELRDLMAEARHDDDLRQRALPAAVRLAVTRHLGQCGACQRRADECMTWWGPELVPLLAAAEPSEHAAEASDYPTAELRGAVPEPTGPRSAPGAHRRTAPNRAVPDHAALNRTALNRTASDRAARTVLVRPLAAAGGAGLLVALLLLAFVWPGFLHSTPASALRSTTAQSAQDHPGSGGGAPQLTGTTPGVPAHGAGSQGAPTATGSPHNPAADVASPSSSAETPTPTPSELYTLPPTTPTTPTATPTRSGQPTPTPSSSPSKSPSPSTSASASTSPPIGVPSTPPITTPPSTVPTSSTPTPTTSPSTSAATPSPTLTPSAADTSASATPSPTVTTASPTPSASTSTSTPSESTSTSSDVIGE